MRRIAFVLYIALVVGFACGFAACAEGGGDGGQDGAVDSGEDAQARDANTDSPLPQCTSACELSGRVFEDSLYSGGRGQAAGSGAVPIAGARVEVYDGSGSWLGSTDTDAVGAYRFELAGGASYQVRVVSATLGSGGTLPEQTFESNGSRGNGGAGALGGNDPRADDTATAMEAGPGDTSVTVVVNDRHVKGVDFGFSFELIVNTKDSGQGSLRQFIVNANLLAGAQTTQFTIPDGTFASMSRDPGFTNGGVAVIQLQSPLPSLSAGGTLIDGSTQTSSVGDTGSAGPEVQLQGGLLPAGSYGLHLTGDQIEVRDLGFNTFLGFGAAAIRTDGADSFRIENNHVTDGSGGDFGDASIFVFGGKNGYVGGNRATNGNRDGFRIDGSGSLNHTVQDNFSNNNDDDGIQVRRGSGHQVVGNTFRGNGGSGVEVSASATVVENNIFQRNAQGVQCGVGCEARVASNTIEDSVNAAVVVVGTAVAEITENSIAGNSGLGIDLAASLPGDGVTANDAGDVDTGPNDLLNFPVLSSATISGADLSVAGSISSAGARIELFVADPDPSGHGEGKTFIGAAQEGSSADGNGGTSANGDRLFQFTVPRGAATVGATLTATATSTTGRTSEFSANMLVQ